MGFTLASSTESQEELERVATLDSADWKTAPVKSDEVPGPQDIPKSVPQKLYNELREEQLRQKKQDGPDILRGEDQDTSKSDRLEQVESAIDKARQSEARRIAAEARVAEAKAKLGSEAETPVPTEREVGARQRFERGSAKYSDYGDAVADAKRAGLIVSERAARAIEATRNSEDLVYYLMKNPEICSELFGDDATQRVGELSAHLMQHSPQATQAQQHRQQADPRPQELFEAHNQRMAAIRRADPEAAAAVDRAGQLPINHAVSLAVIEQENSEAVVIHFAKHPEVLAELNELPPSAALPRVGRIAEQLASKAAAGRERARPPAPITPVGSSSTRSGASIFDPDVPMSTFIRERNRQDYLRRREGRR